MEKNPKVDLAHLFRHIQNLQRKSLSSLTSDEITVMEELDFFHTVTQAFSSGYLFPENIIPIPQLYSDGLKSLASRYGFQLAESGSGQLYLSWAKGIFDEE